MKPIAKRTHHHDSAALQALSLTRDPRTPCPACERPGLAEFRLRCLCLAKVHNACACPCGHLASDAMHALPRRVRAEIGHLVRTLGRRAA